MTRQIEQPTKSSWIKETLKGMPSDWEVRPLDALISSDAPICYGILMPGLNISGGIPVVKVKDLSNGTVLVDSLLHTSQEIDAKYHRSRLQEGDILLSIRGSVGTVACVPASLDGANITQDTARIRPSRRDIAPFLIQVLQAEIVQAQIEQNTVGQAVQGINIGELRRLKIPIPPVTERKAVCSMLEIWDDNITKIRLVHIQKRRLKKGLQQNLLTGKRQFPEFVRTNEKRSTYFGTCPPDWDYPRLGQIATEVSERSLSENRYTVLSCSKHHGLVDSLEYFGKRVFSSDTSNYKVVRRGQFAYATNHIEEGSIGLLSTHEAGLISPIYTVFETDARKVYAPFLFRLFKTELYRHIFEVNTSSSVDRRGSLRWAQFATIHVPLPTLGEQRRIADVLDTVDCEIDLLKRQADALTRQKKALMQKLLTGQIRVKV